MLELDLPLTAEEALAADAASPRRRRVRQSQTRPVPPGLRPPPPRSVLHPADASRRHNPWAADIYNRARARGTSHTHATRILAPAWAQIIWRLWHDHDTYDPLRHTALQRVIAAGG